MQLLTLFNTSASLFIYAPFHTLNIQTAGYLMADHFLQSLLLTVQFSFPQLLYNFVFLSGVNQSLAAGSLNAAQQTEL